jgi:hypothetical protein
VFPFNKLKLNQPYVPLTENKKTDELRKNLDSVTEGGVAGAPQNQEVQAGHLY